MKQHFADFCAHISFGDVNALFPDSLSKAQDATVIDAEVKAKRDIAAAVLVTRYFPCRGNAVKLLCSGVWRVSQNMVPQTLIVVVFLRCHSHWQESQ